MVGMKKAVNGLRITAETGVKFRGKVIGAGKGSVECLSAVLSLFLKRVGGDLPNNVSFLE